MDGVGRQKKQMLRPLFKRNGMQMKVLVRRGLVTVHALVTAHALGIGHAEGQTGTRTGTEIGIGGAEIEIEIEIVIVIEVAEVEEIEIAVGKVAEKTKMTTAMSVGARKEARTLMLSLRGLHLICRMC
jgi:hypothetical protein